MKKTRIENMAIAKIAAHLPFTSKISQEKLDNFSKKVDEIAKKVLFGAIAVIFLSINPGFFFTGFIIGWICKDQTTNEMDKINTLWKKHFVDESNWVKKAAICSGIVGVSLLTLQYTVPLCTFLFAAKVGAMTSKYAEEG